MKRYFLVMALLAITGCDKKSSTDGTKERVRAEQEAMREGEKDRAKKEQEAVRESEAKVQAEKAEKMETELTLWHHYYSALEGQYMATFQSGGRTYKLQLFYIKNLPPFQGGRVRQLSEIENDKLNLAFQVKANQWEVEDGKIVPGTNVPCEASPIKFQNMDAGALIATLACKFSSNSYSILFSEEGVAASEIVNKAKSLANLVNRNELHKIEIVVGEVRYANDPQNPVLFNAKRVK